MMRLQLDDQSLAKLLGISTFDLAKQIAELQSRHRNHEGKLLVDYRSGNPAQRDATLAILTVLKCGGRSEG